MRRAGISLANFISICKRLEKISVLPEIGVWKCDYFLYLGIFFSKRNILGMMGDVLAEMTTVA